MKKSIVVSLLAMFLLFGCSTSADSLDENGEPPVTVQDIPIDTENYNSKLDSDLNGWIYLRFINDSDCPILRYQLTIINHQGVESYLQCDQVISPGDVSPMMKGLTYSHLDRDIEEKTKFTFIKYTYENPEGKEVDVVYDAQADEYKLEPWDFSENDY